MRNSTMRTAGRGAILVLTAGAANAASPPRPDHVVVVIEENKSLDQIIGLQSQAPYIDSLASKWANFSDSHGIERPSQPNYLDLFSGSNQGITSNSYPAQLPFNTPNLGAQLIAQGDTFVGYAQTLPQAGSQVEEASTVYGENQYERKHNPWANWQAAVPSVNQYPATTNQPFDAFPTDFSQLPSVSFVVPDEQNDMHDGSIQQGDAWLKSNLNRYYNWAMLHNSMLIVTFDEDNFTEANHIPMVFAGPMIRPGNYAQRINHFDVLRTIESMYGLPYIGAAASATTITNAFYSASRAWNPGDANFDGAVTAADFTILSEHFSSANGTWDCGDFNDDRIVNALDFNALAGNYGSSSAIPTGVLIPEPAVAGIGWVILARCTVRFRGRRQSRVSV